MSGLPTHESRLRPLLAWLIIAGVIGLIVYSNAKASRLMAGESPLNDARIKLTGRVAIAFKTFRPKDAAASPAMWRQTTDPLIQGMEREAHSPEDKLHIAIIAGELQGKEQALARLDALSTPQPSADVEADIAALRTIYSDEPGVLDGPSQERLIKRHDYFARVALAYGVDPKTEPRKSLEESATITMLVLGLIGLGFLFLAIVSFGLLITAIVLKVQGKIQRAYVPDPAQGAAFLEGFALYLAVFFLGFGLLRRLFGLTSLNWEWLALLIVPAAVLWISRRGVPMSEQRRAFGWHSGRGWLWEIASGIGGYVAGLPIAAVGIFISAVLIRQTNVYPQHPLFNMLGGDRWHVLALYALACVFAPVMEETMFRGALFHHLRGRSGWLISSAVVAFIFAIMHPQGWAAIPALGAIAMVLAALREWRGSIIAPIAAHACNNFLVLTLALLLLR